LTTTITIRQAVHPAQAKSFDTAELREAFHVDGLFQAHEVRLTYWHVDRLVVGGAMPVSRELRLEAPKAIGTSFFLDRREAAFVNLGGPARITADGEAFDLGALDILYLGRGARDVRMAGAGGEAAKLYIVSAPAHQSHPHRRITADEAKVLRLGSPETANVRTLLQFVHPDVCASCQLVLGITRLDAGSIWNTMPAHVHDRRCEAYLYFDMAPETRVFHFMGDPAETRHLVVANEEAILSPGWSIHSGAGTSRYSFVWAMAGDNQDFTDMDMVPMEALR
jgi:4-deoxy-L-threo-5-hexosulose-uronate ketol-isomerase